MVSVMSHGYLQSSAQSPLGLPFGQSHVPNVRFNLFHIDNQEMHLNMLQSSFYDATTKHLYINSSVIEL